MKSRTCCTTVLFRVHAKKKKKIAHSTKVPKIKSNAWSAVNRVQIKHSHMHWGWTSEIVWASNGRIEEKNCSAFYNHKIKLYNWNNQEILAKSVLLQPLYRGGCKATAKSLVKEKKKNSLKCGRLVAQYWILLLFLEKQSGRVPKKVAVKGQAV